MTSSGCVIGLAGSRSLGCSFGHLILGTVGGGVFCFCGQGYRVKIYVDSPANHVSDNQISNSAPITPSLSGLGCIGFRV